MTDVEMHCVTCTERLGRDIYVSSFYDLACRDHFGHTIDRVLPFKNFMLEKVAGKEIGEPMWSGDIPVFRWLRRESAFA
jgi:hypothetical protein